MAVQDIKPTRSELIQLKRKIRLSERGYNILKMKRDGLILEFFNVLEKAKTTREDLQEKYKKAVRMSDLANTVEGSINLKAAALSVKETPSMARMVDRIRSPSMGGMAMRLMRSPGASVNLLS